MVFYHITLRENLECILAEGLCPSSGGLDGPGVYLWKGPLADAVREADFSLSDNHYEMSQADYKTFTQQLVMLAVTVPDNAVFSVEWSEYVVWNVELVPPERVNSLGSFYDLLEKFYPRSDIARIVEEAESRSGMKCVATVPPQIRDFER